MKDFYKILGLKEGASEEEIRERWIELTKRYHPDRDEGASSGEKIREVNEAYQVLKHSSTRVEYDLKRAYERKERKRTVHFKRWGVSAGVVIIFIIAGVIYIKNFETKQINSMNPTNPVNQKNQNRQINQTNQINKMNQTSRQGMIAQSGDHSRQPIASVAPQRMAAPAHQDPGISTSSRQRLDAFAHSPLAESPHPSTADPAPPHPSASTPPLATAFRPQINPGEQIHLPRLPRSETVRGEMRSPFHRDRIDEMNQRNQIDEINQMDQIARVNRAGLNVALAQFIPPSLLATEEEVKKFLDHYANGYHRKDTYGILSLFSSKAVQNQKDGLEEIRKRYADFFNEGHGIRYSLQDLKIEIYQNAVEVKARYEIEQIEKTTGEKEVWRGPVRWVLIKEDGKLRILSLDYQYQPPLREEGGVQ
jgi:curved DNA-binding protein CbpA